MATCAKATGLAGRPIRRANSMRTGGENRWVAARTDRVAARPLGWRLAHSGQAATGAHRPAAALPPKSMAPTLASSLRKSAGDPTEWCEAVDPRVLSWLSQLPIPRAATRWRAAGAMRA